MDFGNTQPEELLQQEPSRGNPSSMNSSSFPEYSGGNGGDGNFDPGENPQGGGGEGNRVEGNGSERKFGWRLRDASRSVGTSVSNLAKDLDRKHGISDKTRDTVRRIRDKTHETSERADLAGKWNHITTKTKRFDKKYGVSDSIVKMAVAFGACDVARGNTKRGTATLAGAGALAAATGKLNSAEERGNRRFW